MIRVFAWTSTDEALPPEMRCVARAQLHMPGGPKTPARWEWAVIIANASTEEEARAKIEAWWKAEVAKEEAKTQRAKAMAERTKARHAAKKPTDYVPEVEEEAI